MTERRAAVMPAAAFVCAALVLATGLALLALGRRPICSCGHVALWYGAANGPETSQHLFDPYSFTHVIHGFLLYGLGWLVGRVRGGALTLGKGLALATAIECAWELAENTPRLIARYRTETVALGYDGDSIVNSLGDIAAMMIGYGAAAALPVGAIVAIAIATEALLGWFIRDNLTLNVLMLLHPIDAIKAWQAKG